MKYIVEDVYPNQISFQNQHLHIPCAMNTMYYEPQRCLPPLGKATAVFDEQLQVDVDEDEEAANYEWAPGREARPPFPVTQCVRYSFIQGVFFNWPPLFSTEKKMGQRANQRLS